MKLQNCRMGLFHSLRSQILRMDPCAADAREVQIKALGKRHLKAARHKLDSRVDCPHFVEGSVPALVYVLRTRVSALVTLKLLQWHVDNRHADPPPNHPIGPAITADQEPYA